MASKSERSADLTAQRIEAQIQVIRGQRVLLDSDLAELYGVETKRINEAVRRNSERFPEDFAFQLSELEFTNLKSQIATSSVSHGGRRKLPWVFTEQGVAMLSGVLNSPTAIQVNIEIMRAFVRMRRLLATPGDLVTQLMELAETVQLHDEKIKVISTVLKQMMQPPPSKESKGRIGFRHPDAPTS